MSKTIRIRTDVGNDNALSDTQNDKNIKISLNQDFDFIEILSLKISQEEAYRRFCSDYGVVVGRVIVNNGFGVPNAKVSIFIPLADEDRDDEEIREIYPYEVVTDRDSEGIRYNLLSQSGVGVGECHTPIGTFPEKREFQDNDTMLEIYNRYYKFTTTTNQAGDFMIFGVPVGNHMLHVDVDISDIGIISQRPYDFISQGVPAKKFASPTKFNGGNNIDNLVQVKSQNKGVNVIPFWGDTDNCDIGISRVDIDLNYNLTPSAIFTGSIFGDSEKHSINKRCKPRRNLGKICESTTGEGTIEMIRKNLDGTIQRFDVEGGRVIDEDGTWAYQVPMNLDFMVTDEFGNLIPSEDPTRGIPTRSRVRFRIGLDPTGGEGRLRTRAKYLVPHNPTSFENSDYSFDETTSDDHFRDMSWNKVYTVKNFITRFQTSPGGNNRNFVGIKDVDDCPSSATPFPYNRLDGDFNPLFVFLCFIITLVVIPIIAVVNSVLVSLINIMIKLLNIILNGIFSVLEFITDITCVLKIGGTPKCRRNACAKLGGTCLDGDACKDCDTSQTVNPVSCISLDCQGEVFAPGCIRLPSSQGDNGFDVLQEIKGTIPLTEGLAECITLSLAEALNVFEFEFYNDWVNGTLYSFLLKYKKKRNGKEKFCEYDCDDFVGDSDNDCKRNRITDTCTKDTEEEGGKVVQGDENALIKDGLIKQVNGELYYAAYTHEKDLKLYATDLTNLGAVLDCDWQGQPFIIDQLLPTSYVLPPLIKELDDEDTSIVVTSGIADRRDFADIFKNDPLGLFFSITCIGPFFDTPRNCINLRRQCEIGMGLDEDKTDEGGTALPGCPTSFPDSKINNCEIDNLLIRNQLAFLNNDSITDVANANQYFNDTDDIKTRAPLSKYNTYRNLRLVQSIPQTDNSYYFYFGTQPGRSALEKMVSRFFTTCERVEVKPFIIEGDVTEVSTIGGNDGTINITIDGGTGPFVFLWTGPNGFVSTLQNISTIETGTYTVTVSDSMGSSSIASFFVPQPQALGCDVSVVPATKNGVSDGKILVNGVFGGVGPYSALVTNNGTGAVLGPQTLVNGGTEFAGLPAGNYTVAVSDNTSPTPQVCSNILEIEEPVGITISPQITNNTCFGRSEGSINYNTSGGQPPYTFVTRNSGVVVGTTSMVNNLPAGSYNLEVTDSISQVETQSVTVTEPSRVASTFNTQNVVQSADCVTQAISIITFGSITASPSGGAGGYTFDWTFPDGTTTSTANPITGLTQIGTYNVTIEDSNGCTFSTSIQISLLQDTTTKPCP